MKSSIAFLALGAVLVLLAPFVMAAPNPADRQPAAVMPPAFSEPVAEVNIPGQAGISPALASNRWIARTSSFADKLYFRLLGCEITNELDDATAVECPAGVRLKNAEPDRLLYVADLEADRQTSADAVWAMSPSITGDDVTVAVLDTGIDGSHPELSGSLAGGKSFVRYTKSYSDDQGHGTHVSGIITADGVGGAIVDGQYLSKGAAPGAKIWMGKVCNKQGSCWSSDIAKGIEYVVKGPDGVANNGDEPAKIISISIGGGAYADDCDGDYLASKVNWAVSNGVTTVVAAGNSASGVSSPGCASKAITVGAVNKADTLASWSGRGLSMKKHGIVAPGVGIYSTLPGNSYDYWSGTSMATPHISAVIALMKQKNPALTDAQIKSNLLGTSHDLGEAGADSMYGYGRVNALAAVMAS